MKINYDTQIRIEAEGLEVGQSRRVLCPFCNGGDSHEQTLSVTRSGDGVLYNCHRASCGQRGFTGTSAWTQCTAPAHERKLQPYEGSLLELEQKDKLYFAARYGLVEVSGFLFRNDNDEYVLPISWLGHERGYNVRQPWDGAPRYGRPHQPKSKVWMHADRPVQAAYQQLGPQVNRFDRVVVVEDQLSAYKASFADGVDCAVALLGSHMNLERVSEIVQLRPREVIIALDADATKTAFKHGRDFGLAFPKVRVAILDKDLKDTKLLDIPRALGL